MESRSNTNIPPGLEPVLRKLRARIRGVITARGVLVTTVTALGGLLALAGIDLAFAPLPPVIRWLCPVAWAGAVASVACFRWWRPLRKPLDLVRIARWLETRHPELDERVSTVMELSLRGETGMSTQLIHQLAKEAVASLEEINPKTEVSTHSALRWLLPAAALALVWTLLFAIWPDPTTRHVVRSLVPTSTLGNAAGRITVTPGSVELIGGDPIRIHAVHSAGPGTPLELILHLDNGSTTSLPMTVEANGCVHQIGKVDRSFDYQVRSGRETSDRFKVTAWPEPRINDPRVTLEFPAYTGWTPREQALGDGVKALVGTKVVLRSRLNTPVESARLEIDGGEHGNTSIERAADGGLLATRWTMEAAGRSNGRIMLRHRLGREFEAAGFSLESVADAPPEVKWRLAMEKEIRLRPDDLLESGYEVTDDVGLGHVTLEVQPPSGESALLETDAPTRIGRGEPPVWRGHLSQPVGALASRWPGSKVFKLRMRAEDSRPANLAGPGVGTSEWIVIRIDEGAPSLARQEVDAARSDARETIEHARQLVRQAGDRFDRQRQELQKEEIPEWSAKEMAEAREQLAEAKEKLEDLADRMEESVHAAKANDVREVAATVDEAKRRMEDAPLQDSPKQRDETAALARENTEKAQRQLEKLRDDLQRGESRVEDYARLRELEHKQRELARQATLEDPAGEWPRKQEQVAGALRQEVRQQPQARSEELENEAERAKQLAAEARAKAAAQNALKQATQDPGNTSEELRKQLADAQKEIAENTGKQLADARDRQDNTTANSLPEALQSAEQAARELTADHPENAADSAEKSAKQLEKAADSAGQATAGPDPSARPPAQAAASSDLKKLAERQEDLAEAISALAEGNPGAAAAKLSEMRAAETKQLSKTIRDAPQSNDPGGSMQQAAQASDQAAGKAEQASQAANHGNSTEASARHGEASEQLQQTAARLDQAAAEFARQAAEAAGQKPGDHQAPVPAKPLAKAFQAASQAARADSRAQAANQAQDAADALAQAADGTLRAMQGRAPSTSRPGQSNPQTDPAGSDPAESPRQSGPDPGVPPELAKLGISAGDWEKIKASLKADAAGSQTIALPEEYRELVRGYFEQMSKGGKP